MVMPALTQISYASTTDSYSFGPFAKSRVTATPVGDRAGRTTKATRYTIRVDDIVYASPSDDGFQDITNRMRRVKRILTTRCGHLIYAGRGFGTPDLDELDVNDPSDPNGIRDVAYGPIPEIIEFFPLGGNAAMAAKIAWQVTTTVAECADAKKTGPMDFSYEVDWRIQQGYTTRTITGQLEIPATRVNNARVPPDVADKYWEDVLAAMPALPGFKRDSNRKLNLDKRIISFTVTDQELEPSAFFGGADSWSGDHTTGSQMMGSAFAFWANTINATFKVTRDRKKEDAWDFFTLLLSGRIFNTGKGSYLPLSTQVREELNGQSVTLTHTWRVQSSIAKFLADTHLFADIKGADWQAWAKNKGGGVAGALAARGYMGLVYKPEWDAIIDLCDKKTIAKPPPQVNPPKDNFPKPPILFDLIRIPGVGQKIKMDMVPAPKFGNIKGDVAVRKPTSAADSFLAYECTLAFVATGGTARHKPLGYAPEASSFSDPLDANVKPRSQQGSTPSDTIQSIGPATCQVVLSGEAIRAGYAVVPPNLVSIGGVKATLDDEYFENVDLGNTGGLSVFGGRWVITYILDRVPDGNIPVPTNLLAPDDGSSVERA